MTSPSIISTLETAIGSALRSGGHFLNESEFQAALHHELGRVVQCERGRPAEFGPPFYPAPPPPPPYRPIDVCEQRESRKVDLLAHFDSGAVAIELEFSRLTDWRGAHRGVPLPNPPQSDSLPYEFLKDIHRMERLTEVRAQAKRVVPEYRICAFLSNNPFECEGQTMHERLRLSTRTLNPGHLVQYSARPRGGKETSASTLWTAYPPFRLARSYAIEWRTLKDDLKDFLPARGEGRPYPKFKLLVVPVSYVPVKDKSRRA